MSKDRKYYYMRLKDNFFDSDNMILLESMPDGYLYCNILLKLYLRSLRNEGCLMLNGRIPYNLQMLAAVTRHEVETVKEAVDVFTELGLIEILDNGAIYMMDIQNYIGESSTEADRQRMYQKRIAYEKSLSGETMEESCKKSNSESNKKSTPEIRDKRLENKVNNNIYILSQNDETEKEEPEKNQGDKKTGKPKKEKPARHKYGMYENVLLSDADIAALKQEFPADWQERIEKLSEYTASTGKVYKNHLATIRNWARKDNNKKQPLAVETNNQPAITQPVQHVKTQEEKQEEEAAIKFLEDMKKAKEMGK